MAEAKDFQCPNCGSPLNIQGDAAEIKCPYCGSAVIVPQELRQYPAPVSLSTPVYSNSQYDDDQLAKQISTVGKVATGIALSTMIAPMVITLLVFCVVGAFVAIILFSVNSTIRSALVGITDPHALQTSIAATLAAADIPQIPTLAPTAVPATVAPTLTTPADTPPPTAIPFSTPLAKVLFHDNFSTKKGWGVYKDEYYTLAYVKGGYRIFINGNGGQTTWLDNTNYKDVNVTADVKYVAGPQDGHFGVSCRLKNGAGFYSFEFSSNGWYAIEKYTIHNNDSSSDVLAEGTMDASNFNQDTIYHLRGDCVGDTLTLYMNNAALLQVTDSSYTSGSVGLGASLGSSGDLGVDVLFSSYSVTGK